MESCWYWAAGGCGIADRRAGSAFRHTVPKGLTLLAAAFSAPLSAQTGERGQVAPSAPAITAIEGQAAVRRVVIDLLDAVSVGDTARARLLLAKDGQVTSIIHRSGREPRIAIGDWDDYLEGVGPDRSASEERLGPSTVMLGDGLATLWAPYTFLRGGAVQHCGQLSASLVRSGGNWLVQGIAWTVRTTGCGE